MPEPISTLLLAQFQATQLISSLIGGTIGNRADAIFCKSANRVYDRIKNKLTTPANHEILKAVRRAYLRSTIMACESVSSRKYNKIDTALSKAARNLKEVSSYLKNQLKELEKPNFTFPKNQFNDNPRLIFESKGIPTQERMQELILKQKNYMISELKNAGLHWVEKDLKVAILDGWHDKGKPIDWFDLMRAYFIDDYKNNQRLRSIIDSKNQLGIISELERLGVSADNFIEYTNNSHEKIKNYLTKIDNVTKEIEGNQFTIIKNQKKIQKSLKKKKDKTIKTIKRQYNKLEKYLTNKDIVEIIKSLNKSIDTRINDLLPKGIYSNKLEDFEKFESDKIVTSLVQIGIPINTVLQSIQKIPTKIEQFQNEVDQSTIFTTNHLRKIIHSLILSLGNLGQSEEKAQFWATSYARRYGNIDEKIKIYSSRDNSLYDFDFKFIINQLFPELFNKAYGGNMRRIIEEINLKNNLKECAREILFKVNMLNIHQIRYKTIYSLVYDLATQPPHPWLTSHELKKSHVIYHLEKVEKHYSNYKKRHKVEHSLFECIEHACALILSEYHSFLGIGHLQPLYSLINYLNIKDNNPVLWDQCEISNLHGDMLLMDLDYEEFRRNLNTLKGLLQSFYSLKDETRIKIDELLDNLINVAMNLPEIKEMSYDRHIKSIHAESDLKETIGYLLKSIPQIKFLDHFDKLKHEINGGVFTIIKPFIKLSYSIGGNLSDAETNKVREYYANKFSNFIIIFSIDELKHIPLPKDENVDIINITVSELFNVIRGTNRIGKWKETIEYKLVNRPKNDSQ